MGRSYNIIRKYNAMLECDELETINKKSRSKNTEEKFNNKSIRDRKKSTRTFKEYDDEQIK